MFTKKYVCIIDYAEMKYGYVKVQHLLFLLERELCP